MIDTEISLREGLEVLVDDMGTDKNGDEPKQENGIWVGTSYCGDLKYVQARIPE